MRSELISIGKLHTLASLCGLNTYLQKTFYFLVLQRNIKLKTSKHEFTDISDQNKQGFEGKKLSRTGFTAFEENLCQTLPTRGIEGKDSHRRTGRGGRGGLQPPQSLGNSDFLGSKRKFGQSQFLKTFPCFLLLLLF